MGPLTGLKVIDLTHVMAGPTCTLMLADMGAEVIKIEKAPSGDDTRHMIPPKIGEEAAAFLMMNRNKRGIVLDLKTEGGKSILRRLIATADVLVENFAPGVMERLGFGYEDLRKDYPSLIYCSLSGFGRTGPYNHRRGFDLVAQAMSGIMSFTGESPAWPAGEMRRAPVGYNRGHSCGDGHPGRLYASTEDQAGPVGGDLAVRGRTGADLLAIGDCAGDRGSPARDGIGASAQRPLSSL
jgi:crotonobetainyl-CoA:carnitine CoA-transferase CaiB-like acyl-CoA transferase